MPNAVQLSVLLPAYNEAGQLRRNLYETIRTLEGAPSVPTQPAFYPFELIVIDDGSSDGTAAAALDVARQDKRVRVMSYQPNAGKGAALRRGFGCAQGSLVAFLDADLDLHPRLLFVLEDVMSTQHADVVIGSKQHPQSHIDYPLLRRAYSLGYFVLVQALFDLPLRDTQTGIKLFKREVLDYAFPRLSITGYAFDLELLVLAHTAGYRITDAPVSLTSQRMNRRIRPRDVMVMLRDTINLWLRMRANR